MAKKVRKKPEEEEAAAFDFPVFDEQAFVQKETELGWALAVAGTLAVGLGIVSWLLTGLGLPWWGPFAIGLLGLIASPFVIARLRRRSDLYTKGDWAGLIALEFFGWLALWFLLVNLT